MKYRMRFLFAAVAGLMALASCAEEEPVDTDRFETVALHAWMKLNRPELLENYQEEGGYYVDVRKTGDKTALPVNDTVCWVRFDFSGRDLRGNIVLTRREEDARLSGTYTKYTHYVPYYRLCGTEPLALLEGTHLAMRNTLTLGQTYYDTYKDERGFDSRELLLRPGTVVDLYMPSSVVGSGGVEGDGGYEGQYSLSAGRPMIVSMEVISTDKNPLEAEGSAVDAFCKQDGGLMLYDNTALNKRPESDEHAKHPYNIAERWVNVCDTVPQLYADFRYTPDRKLSFPQASRYKSKYMPYAQFDELEQKIADALVERFHADKPYEGVKLLRSDSVTVDGEAKIWYIRRSACRLGGSRRLGEDLVHRPLPRRLHLRHEHRRGEAARLRRGGLERLGARLSRQRHDLGLELHGSAPQVRPVGRGHLHVGLRLRRHGRLGKPDDLGRQQQLLQQLLRLLQLLQLL